ncbi:GCN5-related N-acetyltransferase [Fulvivirga imtechensis AK7]|uniref:GCN5-related N-acetyltransferase n=1 Tax=Fulvivirga imtechensis AK7 TaxID=1237149 RepID=L8JWM0_9BACT|nr:GNAT family N-acetyltransferase [Fulvivirga imtechensis]ELR72598.1 GCN5-related N-acetyltransferase [Fulvivirga imtechensis AK7]
MTIRPAKQEDIAQIISLCRDHAEYEKASFDPGGKEALLSKHLLAKDSMLKCLVADRGDRLMGYTTFMRQFSTWDAAFYLYLDCLYLRTEVRGQGFGYKIMQLIKAYAKAEGCTIIRWQTPDFNTDAIAFYQRLGAKANLKQRFFWSAV